jgi:hypothetical protein
MQLVFACKAPIASFTPALACLTQMLLLSPVTSIQGADISSFFIPARQFHPIIQYF